MKKAILILLCSIYSILSIAQITNKESITHKDLVSWNKLESTISSENGKWVAYELNKEEGDGELHLYQTQKKRDYIYSRAYKSQFDNTSSHFIYLVQAHQDSIRALKKRKAEESEYPNDTLNIVSLSKMNSLKIPNVKSYKLPSDWGSWIAIHRETTVIAKDDSTSIVPSKEEGKKNGTTLTIRDLENGEEFNFPYVKQYKLAKEGKSILFETTGDSTIATGIHVFDCSTRKNQVIYEGKGKFKHLTFHESGNRVAFLVDSDTTDIEIRPFNVMLWEEEKLIKKVASNNSSFLKEDWIISEFQKPQFSKNGKHLYFGVKTAPEMKDTLLLKDEKPVVEIWNYTDERLFPQQKVRKKQIAEQSYLCGFNLESNQITQLSDETVPNTRLVNEGNADYVLGTNDMPYMRASSWEGFPIRNDIYIIGKENGQKELIQKGLRGRVSASPMGKYLYWYNHSDTTWNTYNVAQKQTTTITTNELGKFYDERNDRPMLPYSKGTMGWSEEDTYLYIYDEYDIWRFDMRGMSEPLKLTDGRTDGTIYRYVRLDSEERWLDITKPVLVRTFNERNKQSGYGRLDLQTGTYEQLINGDYSVNRRVTKAKNADTYIIRRSTYQKYPNLELTDSRFKKIDQISDANPQQSNYSWGSIELVQWTSTNGKQLQGMLVKPDNFDPNKQYPMIVNFYERSSDRLHAHRFVDRDRIGGQGHSWGGYQIAHLVTVSDVFACAESGAPVVNMTSAYGGIRWGSGLSRMFQYEHTQSRIGGTLWEKHLNYIENSPIFRTDKINTPLLILHNDKDGAVPWYQGIEWFVALRRLDKPAWMLNYNDEPHWPVKLPNRKDFNQKMMEFFDYYLKDQKMPEWME